VDAKVAPVIASWIEGGLGTRSEIGTNGLDLERTMLGGTPPSQTKGDKHEEKHFETIIRLFRRHFYIFRHFCSGCSFSI
jgi:hypothetical protein